MKVLRQVVVSIVVWMSLITAHAQEVRYTNDRQKEVNKEEATFYDLIIINTDGSAEVSRYTIDSVLVRKATYKDFKENRGDVWIRHGAWQEWHRNGQLAKAGQYIQNKAEGTFASWFENGQLQYKSYYRKGALQDTLYGYYEDGSLRRVETYFAGKMLSGEVYARSGALLPFFPYQELPQFPGGESMLLKFVSRNMKYPKTMLRAGKGGVVVIRFIVEKDGTINAAELIKQVHPDADAEAMRVVRSMPKWEPGKLEGEIVPMEFYLPLRFSVR